MLGLFVGGEVLACLVYAACVCVHAFRVGVVRECRRGGGGDSRPGYDDGDVVEQAHLCELPNGILVF